MQVEKKNVVGTGISIVIFTLALIGALLNVVLYIAWQGAAALEWGSFYMLEHVGTLLLNSLVITVVLGLTYVCAQGRNYNRLLLLPFGMMLAMNLQEVFAALSNFLSKLEWYFENIEDYFLSLMRDLAELLSGSVGIIILVVLIILVARQGKKNIFAPFLAGTAFLFTVISDLVWQISQLEWLGDYFEDNFVGGLYSIGYNWPNVLLWLGLIVLLIPVRAAKQVEEAAE